MRLDTATENKIRDCLIEVIDPVRTVIFGSYARGEAGVDSDIEEVIAKGALVIYERH